jgi:integrase/recombinase XerD
MNTLTSWQSRVEMYLVHRRNLGFDLALDATRLRHFARFADQITGEDRLTVALAAQWARASNRQTPITWARRIEVLRGFAKFWQRYDATTEIPPADLFGTAHRRLVPHIFTDAELATLLQATDRLVSPQGLRPATCRTIFGLLAASGLRISEATKLTRADVDLDAGILHIREAKFHKSRLVPVHPSVAAELKSYVKLRDRIVLRPVSDCFFVRDDGKAANQAGLLYALQTLCRELGGQPRGDYSHHRLHDLRHTFIVRSTLRSYERGIDPDRAVAALSTYVGHAKVSDTYWYFTGIPELMAIAGERFHRYAQGGER